MIKLIELWSANASGRSARGRPLAAAWLAPVAPRTRAVELTDLIQDTPKQQNKRIAINSGDSFHISPCTVEEDETMQFKGFIHF